MMFAKIFIHIVLMSQNMCRSSYPAWLENILMVIHKFAVMSLGMHRHVTHKQIQNAYLIFYYVTRNVDTYMYSIFYNLISNEDIFITVTYVIDCYSLFPPTQNKFEESFDNEILLRFFLVWNFVCRVRFEYYF